MGAQSRGEQKRIKKSSIGKYVFESGTNTFSSLREEQVDGDGKISEVEHVSPVNSVCFGGRGQCRERRGERERERESASASERASKRAGENQPSLTSWLSHTQEMISKERKLQNTGEKLDKIH